MPHFDTPKRDKQTLALVKETLEKFFCSNGLEHSDVRWRNIGVYKDDDAGLWKIVIFDLVGVKDQASGDWAAKALENLQKSISE
jgi:hypothetical protein